MAWIENEQAYWEPTIYLIQKEDPPTGGEFGICNIQARQLANRTKWLQEKFHQAHNSNGVEGSWGEHYLTEADVAVKGDNNTGIPESCIAFTKSPSAIHADTTAMAAKLDTIEDSIADISGKTGVTIASAYKSLLLSWKYSGLGYTFCMFNDSFNFFSGTKYSVSKTVNRSDSIDISGSKGGLVAGEYYVLTNTENNSQQVVQIKEICVDNRVVLTSNINYTSMNAGTLCKISTSMSNSKMVATAGDHAFTDAITTDSKYPYLLLTIGFTGESSSFTVEYTSDLSVGWTELEANMELSNDSLGNKRVQYRLKNEKPFYLKFSFNSTVTVDYMIIVADESTVLTDRVRTPKLDSNFNISRFGAYYNSTFQKLEVVISTSPKLENATHCQITTLTFSDSTTVGIQPHIVSAGYNIAAGSTYYCKARYFSSDGYASAYSDITPCIGLNISTNTGA